MISSLPAIPKPPSRDAVLKRSSHPPSLRFASKNKPSEKSFIGAFGQLPKRGSTVGNLRRSGTPLRRSSSAQSKILRTSRIPRLAAPLALENPARPCPVVRTISVIRKGSTPLPQAPPVGPETSRCAHVRCAHSYVCMLCRQGLANRGVCNAHRVGVGFPEGVKLLHFYAEFLATPDFYTFTLLAHFFLRALRARRQRKLRFSSKT